ncbi:MAG TPA: MFS transporter [Ktedonobacterales bacterium]|jgi:MFS family permease
MARLRVQAVSYLRQFGRMNRNARLYLLSNTLNSITVGIFALLYNLYLVALGYQADFIGWLLVIGVAGGALGMVTTSPLMARLGTKATLFWSSVVAAAAGTLQLVIPQAFSLTITSFVLGVAGGIYLVIGAPLLADGSQATARSHIFSLNAALALITAVIGQALGGYLPHLVSLPTISDSGLLRAIEPFLVSGAQARSYELALLLAGVIAAPSFLPIILMDPTPPRQPTALPGQRAAKRAGAALAGARQRLSSRFQALKPPRLRTEALKALRGPIGQLAMVEGLIGLGAGLFIPYFNLYFVQHLGVSTELYGLITAVSTALMAVTTLAGPFFAARLGKVRAAVLGHLISLPFLAILGFTRALPLVLAAYLVRGSLMNMAEPVLLSYFMSVVRPTERASANSAYNLGFWGCWAAGGALGGVIIAANNFTLPFVLAALIYLLATALLWRCFKDRREVSADLSADEPGLTPGSQALEEGPELHRPQEIDHHPGQPQRGIAPVHTSFIED